MADQAQPARPRIALVFGDAASASHLREAVKGHTDIVYDTAAADFDAMRLADSHATAALVNLDGAAWLDTIEAKLNEAGVVVVFNDPEISRGLEGWAQARWLRHLTAKLSGSSDFDPPRPIAEVASVSDSDMGTSEAAATDDAQASADRPLSSAEIASMTADFVEQEPNMHAAAAATAAVDDEFNAGTLDVDTEALSALIDARLAETDDHSPSDSSPVWTDDEAHAAATTARAETVAPNAAANIDAPVARQPSDIDGDGLETLPALGDWQLVDPEAPIPTVVSGTPAKTEPAISLDFAGLELVPMEMSAPVAVQNEPIEHHLYGDNRVNDASNDARPAMQSARGGQA